MNHNILSVHNIWFMNVIAAAEGRLQVITINLLRFPCFICDFPPLPLKPGFMCFQT